MYPVGFTVLIYIYMCVCVCVRTCVYYYTHSAHLSSIYTCCTKLVFTRAVLVSKACLLVGGHVTHMGIMRGLCRVLVQKPNVKRPIEISTRSSDNNIKIHLKRIN
jgi:hypothetical protein